MLRITGDNPTQLKTRGPEAVSVMLSSSPASFSTSDMPWDVEQLIYSLDTLWPVAGLSTEALGRTVARCYDGAWHRSTSSSRTRLKCVYSSACRTRSNWAA